MAAAHARSQSSIPGFVVIVLATAAILYGVAIVRKSSSTGDEVVQELVQLRQQVTEQAEAVEKIERGVVDYAASASNFELEVSSLRSSNRALEQRVGAIASSEPAAAGIDESEVAAAVAKVKAEAEARFQTQAEEMAELTAEIHALNDRANQLEHELSAARKEAASIAAPESTASPSTEASPTAPQPTPAAQEEPEGVEAQDAEPASDEPAEADEGAPEAPMAAAAAAAEEHAELLAPFFGAGFEQPDGSRTSEPGPMSYSMLVATGALDELTSDTLEENEALRTLANIASHSPNDRELWPYARGDRTRTWYLRNDGRMNVPLAHQILTQYGEAFVELGYLAE